MCKWCSHRPNDWFSCLYQQLDTEKESTVPLISRTRWSTPIRTNTIHVALSSAKFSLESLQLVVKVWKYCLKNLQESFMTQPSMMSQIRRYSSCSPIITCIPSILSPTCHATSDWMMHWLTFSRVLLHLVGDDICRTTLLIKENEIFYSSCSRVAKQ